MQYKRESSVTYLILDEPSVEDEQYYQIKMLEENKMENFLNITMKSFNGENQIYYNISGKQTIKCMFERREMEKEDIVKLLSGLKDAFACAESYLMSADCILMNPEYIYMNASGEVFLCFYPFFEKPVQETIRELSEYLLNHLNHENEEAVSIGYQFYRLTREENFSFIEIVDSFLFKAFQKHNSFMQSENDMLQGEKDVTQKENTVMQRENIVTQKENTVMQRENIVTQKESVSNEYSYLNKTAKTTKTGKKNVIPIICFSGCILIGSGYLYYLYETLTMQTNMTISDIMGRQEAILAAGGIIFGLAGFLLIWIYKQILRNPKLFSTKADLETSKEMEMDFYEVSARGYISDENMHEYENTYKDENTYEDENISEGGEKKRNRYPETVLLKENMYTEERILTEQVKRFSNKRPLSIKLDKFPYIIGKMDGKVDYAIDHKSISRVHAQFLMPDEDTSIVYLQDLNSTNGTYKNGVALDANELIALTAEDEITFGKVTFTYY